MQGNLELLQARLNPTSSYNRNAGLLSQMQSRAARPLNYGGVVTPQQRRYTPEPVDYQQRRLASLQGE